MRKLIIVAILFLAFFSIPSKALSQVEAVVVEMTEEGFEPREVTVDQDTIINFVNQDAKDRWPASNVHPVHDIYSEFDPKKPVQPGESWTFKPNRVGTWRYHDHLSPRIGGTINIVAADDVAEDEVQFEDEDEGEPADFSVVSVNESQGFLARIKVAIINLFSRIFGRS